MRGYSITHLTHLTHSMKSRRLNKSRKCKRRSSKKGGMFRRMMRPSDAAKKAAKNALKEIFGKDPVDAADKAKQAADKVRDALMKTKKTGKSQSPYMTASTFSSPVSFGSPFVETRDKYEEHYDYDPDAFLRTPSKKPDTSEPKLPKSARHQSVVATTSHSYAPRLGNETPVNQQLFL